MPYWRDELVDLNWALPNSNHFSLKPCILALSYNAIHVWISSSFSQTLYFEFLVDTHLCEVPFELVLDDSILSPSQASICCKGPPFQLISIQVIQTGFRKDGHEGELAQSVFWPVSILYFQGRPHLQQQGHFIPRKNFSRNDTSIGHLLKPSVNTMLELLKNKITEAIYFHPEYGSSVLFAVFEFDFCFNCNSRLGFFFFR